MPTFELQNGCVPNIRKTSLDDGLVEAIIPFRPPHLLPSNAVVQMHVHNIGSLRRYGKWETADIAVVVYVYHVGKMIGQKIGFLQSKRLFPHNKEVGYALAATDRSKLKVSKPIDRALKRRVRRLGLLSFLQSPDPPIDNDLSGRRFPASV